MSARKDGLPRSDKGKPLLKNRKLIRGVGVCDVAETVDVTKCAFYRTWLNMFRRCYSAEFHLIQPGYADCSVSPEWHSFSNFRDWMQSQDWEGNELDKDLLVPGNKIYGPKTCAFVPKWLNGSIAANRSKRSCSLRGVCLYNKRGYDRFVAYCDQKIIGTFKTELEAHIAWQKRKVSSLEVKLAEYKKSIFNPSVAAAIQKKIDKIHQDIANNRPTVEV